ncbi:hypothetical protein A0H81_00349 [Grifola frondosa]|uniref:Uncharacterized protein n=1 Tax=Grifola frondosa TaxID=5627 RepID=A0A1C7MPS4_GRIFR|nr:hypothetical protein A0H81_00349 [Grifola frondosa]
MAKRAEREAAGYFPLEGWDEQGNRVAFINTGGVGHRGRASTVLGPVRGACGRCQLDQRPLECFINATSRLCILCFEKSLGCRWNGLTRDRIPAFSDVPMAGPAASVAKTSSTPAPIATRRSSRASTRGSAKAGSTRSASAAGKGKGRAADRSGARASPPVLEHDSAPSLAGTSGSDFDVRSIASSSRATRYVGAPRLAALPSRDPWQAAHRSPHPLTVQALLIRSSTPMLARVFVPCVIKRMREAAMSSEEDVRGWIAASRPSDAVAIGAYAVLTAEVARQREEITRLTEELEELKRK